MTYLDNVTDYILDSNHVTSTTYLDNREKHYANTPQKLSVRF